MSWFSGNCSTGAAWRHASSYDTKVVVSAEWSPSALCGRFPAVVECDTSRKVNWTWRADCKASSGVESNSDGFCPLGTTGGEIYAVPPRIIKDPVTKTSRSCDNVPCQHIKMFSKVYWKAYCPLPRNGWRPLLTPTVTRRRPWFHRLVASAIWRRRVSWKLNVTGHMLYNTSTLFLARNHIIGPRPRNLFHSVYKHLQSVW
jgi:hypothetical protein